MASFKLLKRWKIGTDLQENRLFIDLSINAGAAESVENTNIGLGFGFK